MFFERLQGEIENVLMNDQDQIDEKYLYPES